MKKKTLLLLSTALGLNLQSAWGMEEDHTSTSSSVPIQLRGKTAEHEDDNLFKLLQSAFEKIDKDIDLQKMKTIIIGATGAGKSTLFNYMQHDLRYKYDENESVVYKRKDGEEFTSDIKDGILSATKFPIICNQYVDCPGFEDTSSSEQSIINAYSIHRLLEKTSSTKILLVAKQSELESDRAEHFIKRIARLGQMFSNDIDKFTNSLGFVVTSKDAYKSGKSVPISKEENIKSVRKTLLKIRDDIDKIGINIVKENERENTKEILNVLINENKNNVSVFCKPDYTEDFQDVKTSEKNTLENMLNSREVIENINPILVIDSSGKQLLERFFSRSLIKCQKIIDENFETFGRSIKEYISSSNASAKSLREDFINVEKKIKIDDTLSYNKFVKNLENFYEETKKIFPRINTFHKYLERFKFMEKVGIGLNNESDSAYINTSNKIFEKINEIASSFSVMGEYKPERIDNKLRLSGCIIGTSDLDSESSKLDQYTDIDIISLHSLLQDKNITASGANLTFLSPYWFKKSNIKIDLSGKDGIEQSGFEKNGEGLPGDSGCPGGNFYGHCMEMFGEANLEIISNGGNGNNGTNGTTGAKGKDGEEVNPPEFVSENEEKYTFNSKIVKVYRVARKGEKGATGYSGGAKGLGGNKGNITFNLLQGIQKTTKDGIDGKEGVPGEGGLGGLNPDVQETIEDHDETAFGTIKPVVPRRLAQTGMGIITFGIVPVYTGIKALINTYKEENNNNINNDGGSRAPKGDNGRNIQSPRPVSTKEAIDLDKKRNNYYEYLNKNKKYVGEKLEFN